MRAAFRTAGLIALVMAMAASADSFVRMVRISYLQAPVEASRPAAPGSPARWQRALWNAPVTEGERLRTGAGGELEVQLECGSALRLIPDSELSFPRLRRTDDGVPVTTVAIDRGTAFLTLRKQDSRDLTVNVGGGSLAGWHGTTRLRIEANPGTGATVQLLGGGAELGIEGKQYRLTKSRQLAWSPHRDPVREAASKGGRWAKWSQHRDQEFERAIAFSRPEPLFSAENNTLPPAVPYTPLNAAANAVTAETPFAAAEAPSPPAPFPKAMRAPLMHVPRCAE